jgi:acyl carrier protein phosphodiesterase
MNYLAHLFLAQPTADSAFGNLLGDFRRGTALPNYSRAILNGLNNHYLVDKYTDAHPVVLGAKRLFIAPHRRFAGIALDVVFDHFLILHWREFATQELGVFCLQNYDLLEQRLDIMPKPMQQVVGNMIEHQWLEQYESLDGVAFALEKIAQRIRFKNTFANAIDDLTQHYGQLNEAFQAFFPQLIAHVSSQGIED